MDENLKTQSNLFIAILEKNSDTIQLWRQRVNLGLSCLKFFYFYEKKICNMRSFQQ